MRTGQRSVTCQFCGSVYATERTTAGLTSEEEHLWALQRQKRQAKQEMQQAFAVFASVILFLWVIWLMTTPGGHPWPIYPMGGMFIAAVAIWYEYRSKYGAIGEQHVDELDTKLAAERRRIERDLAMREPSDEP